MPHVLWPLRADSSSCRTSCDQDAACSSGTSRLSSCPACLCDSQKRPPCKGGEITSCQPIPKPRTACAEGREWHTSMKLAAFGACVPCREGRVRAGASRSQQCSACPAGRFQPAKGQGFCHACPAGKFVDVNRWLKDPQTGSLYRGSKACQVCTPGFYSERSGNAACKQCPAGLECSGGANVKKVTG